MRIINVHIGILLNPKMKQVYLKLLLCLLLATSITGQTPSVGQNVGTQPFGFGQSQFSAWGGMSPGGAFQQQPTASQLASGFGQAGVGSQFGAGFGQAGVGSQFGGGFGQGGIGSQFGAGFGQGGIGSQFGAGFGQGGMGSQFGAGFGQAGMGSQLGAGVAQQTAQPVASQAPTADARSTGSDVTSGVPQNSGSSAPVPAVSASRIDSSNVCYNIIDSDFPSFSHYCSALPQTTYSLPNFFGHNSKEQANGLLGVFRPALDSQCFEDIRMFTCPLFFPPCDSDAILPCAKLCRAVKRRCNAFDLTQINCDQLPEKSRFCPSFVPLDRSLNNGYGQDRSAPYNDYGSQARFVNDYPSTSVLTRSSSYGSTDRITPPSTYGSERTIVDNSYGNSVKVAPVSTYGGERTIVDNSYGSNVRITPPSPYGGDRNIVDNSYGNSVKVAPVSTYGGERTIVDNSYGSNVRITPPSPYGGDRNVVDNSYGSSVKVAPVSTYGGERTIVDNSYGSNVRITPPSTYGGERTFTDSSYGDTIRSTGSAYGSSIKSVGSSSYGSDRNIGDNSYGSSVRISPVSTYAGDRSIVDNSYGSTVKVVRGTTYGGDRNIGGSSYGSSVKVAPVSTYGGDRNIGGSSYGSSVKVAPVSTYGGDRNIGGSSYGSSVRVAPVSTYGGSSYGSSVKVVPVSTYGGERNIGGSSYGNSVKSVTSSSYGNGGSYGGSSYGNTGKSTGSSYGSSNNYGSGSSYGNTGSYGSSYGNSGSYGSSYPEQTYGPPYGIQSTGEYTTYYPEKLDLSRCGPTPTENPCTLSGPQYYPIPGYPQCYIQCSLERMFVKPCPNYLVWNTRINACDWPTVAEYPAGNNNYGSSSYSTDNKNSGSESSYSYGRKKRSTVERKKRHFPGGLFSDPINFEVPLGPPVPGLVPLPGFPGPIGIPGPLIPPPFFGPPFIPPFGPIPPPIIPPIIPPIAPIPPPILPPPILPPPLIPPIAPIPPPILPPPLIPPFLPPIVPPLPIPLGGPLLPPLPLSIPATFIPGPPPIFGSPFLGGPFGPFGGPLGGLGGPFGPFGGPFGPFGAPFGGPLEPFGGPFGPFAGPFGLEPFFDDPFDFDFGFGGGFPFGDEFYGGFPGPFFEPFPFPAGYDIYDDFGGKGSYGKGDYGKGGYGKGGYGKGGYKNDYDSYGKGGYNKGYGKSSKNKGGYGNSYSDNSYSKSNYKKNGNYQSKSYKGSNDYSSGYDSDYSRGDYYRRKRNYDLNVDQDTSIMTQNQDRLIPQQARVLSMNLNNPQIRLPSVPVRQSSPCSGKANGANLPHPTDLTKYISCLNEDKYEIMECPSGLIYNQDSDKCENIKNTEAVCQGVNPCLNGGQCHQTSPTTFKCTCLNGWTGDRCEIPLSSCASNPCGVDNECHTLIAKDYQQDYVCSCDGRQSYGLTCGRNTVPNPCLSSEQEREQYYPFAYSANAYIQCNGDLFYVRPCPAGLTWNPTTKICTEGETIVERLMEDQPSSYQINYNRIPSKPTYNRPVVNFADQSTDNQQGLRYRNYNPHVMSNDQRSYNQINARKEIPKINRLFSVPLMKEYNRRFQMQNPTMLDQQYGKHKSILMKQTPDRSTLRFMQSSSYRR